MTTELAKTYDPKAVEDRIYAAWIERDAFAAEPDGRGSAYTIVIPPPNVTDALHLGHALNNTLQDVLIRWRRMEGFNTLWMPGTDHAGIATQTVVEKRILAEEGKRRTDFQRDEFVARVQAWKDEYEQRILGQLKQIGCSCDWRRTRFTMDEVCARAVREMFFRLFADGLIYRGKRLVNWDPATQTVLADDEVEHEEVHGHFYYMRYPLVAPVEVGGDTVEHVTVATTRPETMLGDTAVAMNPADPRADALLGKAVRLPIVGREIPLLADEHVVLPDADSDDEQARFSTGFLKVTPAHDPDDWEIGRRHDLPVVNVLAPDGSVSDRYGWDDAAGTDAEQFLGLDRFEAREAIVEWFREEGLLEDVREYVHQVGHSYRSHVPIEPYLSDQWYIAVKKPIDKLAETFGDGTIEGTDVPANSLAALALKPVLDGRLHFIPDRYAKTYQSWLENLRDWPISRQLWWGHRIPIWRKDGAHEPPGDPAQVTARQAETEEGTITYACVAAGQQDLEKQLADDGWQQDEDVLDTWFSSALWPFSTLGWPEGTGELKTFYPGDVLVTAREIITLWVSRMVMMGQYALGDIPFEDVFIHAMIQDGQGRKMSKSLGNGIDPLTICDSHGADAMRFTLVSMTTQTQDVRMPVEEMTLPDGRKANTSPKFDQGRNFCNKLWNASRFTMMNLAGAPPLESVRPHANLADAWILSRLNTAVRDATRALGAYRYNELGDTLYHFMWDDFCDWYLEIAKARINAGEDAPKAVLAYALDGLLRLLHPVVPFVTEAIWQRLNEVAPQRGASGEPAEPLLVRASWPRADAAAIDPALEQRFETLQQLIREVRNIRTQHNLPRGQTTDVVVEAAGETAELVRDNAELIRSQAAVGELRVEGEGFRPPADAAAATVGAMKLYVLGAVDREAERARLGKEADKLRKAIAGAEGKLGNENFVNKAPEQVVRRERERLADLKTQLAAAEDALAKLS
jgi:valyl-tRNA synthetase